MGVKRVTSQTELDSIAGPRFVVADALSGAWTVYTGGDMPRVEVPQEVTMRQARLALLAVGKLVAVNAAINALPDPQKTAAIIEWEYSSTVRRDSQFVALLGPALGLDAAGLDALFIAAAKLGV